MTPSQWAKSKALFGELIDSEPACWAERLAELDDAEVAEEVGRLLRAHQSDTAFMNEAPAVPQSEPVDRLVGTALGPFRIEKLLGEGGMGRVYLARREQLGGYAAVKVLHGRLAGAQAQRRFQAEQSILARLDHPHIARLLQVGIADDGTPWLAMEHVDGEPFSGAMARLDLAGRIDMLIKLATAVDYAHRQLVVHRDIKPGNVIVDRHGEPKLLDFGIAKQLDEHGDGVTLTRFQPLTPAYAAPEQIRGEPITVATDVYALGVLAYESLSGQRPWTVRGDELKQAVTDGDPPLPSSRTGAPRSRLQGDLDAIVLQAMHRQPSRRYRSAAELADDLRRWRNNEPVLARAQTLAYRGGLFLRRHRVGVTAMVVAFGVLATIATREHRLRESAALEAEKSAQVAAFMLDILDAGDASTADFVLTRESTILDLVERSTARLENAELPDLVRADLAHKLGQVFWGLSEYGQAEGLFKTAVGLRNGELGEHTDTAESYLMLGRVYERSGRFAEMLEVSEISHEMRDRVLGPDHSDTLHSLHRVASAHYHLGRIERAESMLSDLIERWQVHMPEASRELADSTTMRGHSLANMGYCDRAIGDYRRVLELHAMTLPADHPQMAEGMHNLSTCLYELGRMDEAIGIHTRAMAIGRAAFPDDHHGTVIDLEWMARYQLAADNLDEAAQMAKEAVAMAQRLNDEVAPNQVLLDRARQILVEYLRAAGKNGDALELQRDVLASRIVTLPSDHRYIVASSSVLADLVRLEGSTGATALLAEALDLWQVNPGNQVLELIDSMDRFSSEGECEWVKRDWPQEMPPAMDAGVARVLSVCGEQMTDRR